MDKELVFSFSNIKLEMDSFNRHVTSHTNLPIPSMIWTTYVSCLGLPLVWIGGILKENYRNEKTEERNLN